MGLRTRDWDPGPFERLAAAGFAVAGVDYRLSGEAVFPAPRRSTISVPRCGGSGCGPREGNSADTGRTVVWGESAGGHLAPRSSP